MSGAIGILRLGPRPRLASVAGTTERLSYLVPCPCRNYHGLCSSVLGRQRSHITFRTFSASTAALKRRTTLGSTKKSIRDATPLGTEKRRKGSSLLQTEGPTYVKAASVSGEEMVNAIESSRQQGALKASSVGTILGSDPFGNPDPFSTQLEKAIMASSRSRNGSNAESTASGDATTIPDVQAKYLVGIAKWESIRSKEVKIKNITPKNRPKVNTLEHGLDRVLFNPGVHWLQDPRSLVYNFDPYLRSICPPDNFDYDALPAYRTSSLDPALLNIADVHRAKYMGSTSSMTSALSQFYYLISGWKPLKTSHLSEDFSSQSKSFTKLCRAPTSVQLVYKGNGIYAVDADKTFDNSTVLMQLGKSMEKMLTSTHKEFERFKKANSWQVTKEEREQLEAFNYISVDNFVLRSQLDCEDPRLPGKTFDLKTRAAVAIRLDVHNYELNQGYLLRKAHGYLESFEREYYDMMRSAFLKYSLQVRIGQMDGIFVAYHNTARVFGFQYISLDEMDSRLFGTSVMGDECFKSQLRLFSKTLDEITTKYPEQDLKITLDTDEAKQSMNVWVETMPLGAASSSRGRDVQVVFDEKGAPEMQPGADLSLWQIVCFSNVNKVPIVGPFELSETGKDDWELRYKIAELKKPHMMNEYRQMLAQQAEVYADNDEEAAIVAAAAAASGEVVEEIRKSKREIRATSRRDSMRAMLRRISEQGRLKQEAEERRQADKEFMVWEPKGYTKVMDASVVKNAAQPLAGQQETAVESIAARMVRRLREVSAKAEKRSKSSPTEKKPEAVNKGQVAVRSQDQKKNEEDDDEDDKEEAPRIATIYYRRGYDSKMCKLALDDLRLIQKSLSSPITDPTESARMEHLKEAHVWLVKSLNRFDHVRFKMLEVPVRGIDYRTLDREHLVRIAKLMGQPEDVYAATVSDEVLRKKLHTDTARFRSKLYLEYFHNWLHKVVALKDNVKPYKTMEDFLAVDNPRALIRAANGINVYDRMVRTLEFAQGMSKPDAAKKALLTQVYYAEQVFSDDELKEMGFHPRIFDPNEIKSPRDILKDVGTKFQPSDGTELSDEGQVNEQDASGEQAVSSEQETLSAPSPQ
ncbi:MAG: mitochondrial protein Pet127-domain-containing protein [Benniella sp.]|nr:MAG: mitochondrial protein Pet127-domain-containing protein [Benniella sp.]